MKKIGHQYDNNIQECFLFLAVFQAYHVALKKPFNLIPEKRRYGITVIRFPSISRHFVIPSFIEGNTAIVCEIITCFDSENRRNILLSFSDSRLPLSIISDALLKSLKPYPSYCHSQIGWKFLFWYYQIAFGTKN